MIGYEWFVQNSVDWRLHHGAAVPLAMPHVPLPLSVPNVRGLVWSRRLAFARWEEEFDKLDGGEWWHVIKDEPEELERLSRNTRSKFRRGMKRFVAVSLTAEAVADEGFDVYSAAFERYDTFEPCISAAAFRQAIEAMPGDTEFWGVRDSETNALVAFSENLVRDGACFYNTIWFAPEALKAYSGYVLIHEMNKHYLNERGLRYVSDGARSISHETSVHDFLESKFGFRRAFARLRVVYFPGFGILVHCLYPLRRWVGRGRSSVAKKVAVILEQERIRRSCESPGEG